MPRALTRAKLKRGVHDWRKRKDYSECKYCRMRKHWPGADAPCPFQFKANNEAQREKRSDE